MLAAFSKGYVVALSSHAKEMGQELHCLRIETGNIYCISVCLKSNKFAVATRKQIKIYDLTVFKEYATIDIDTNNIFGIPNSIQWTKDGHIITLTTDNGNLVSYLVATNNIIGYNSNSSFVCYLSSLQQITVFDLRREDTNRIWSFVFFLYVFFLFFFFFGYINIFKINKKHK